MDGGIAQSCMRRALLTMRVELRVRHISGDADQATSELLAQHFTAIEDTVSDGTVMPSRGVHYLPGGKVEWDIEAEAPT